MRVVHHRGGVARVRRGYIAHPLGAGPDREANRQRASRWVAWAASQGVAPVADWTRAKGLAIDCALVARCDELWLVGGRISRGMQVEADAARAAGVMVVDRTDLGEEPPG